jgi:hypothetical protein
MASVLRAGSSGFLRSSTPGDSSDPVKKLASAIYRGTIDNGFGKGDLDAVNEVNEILKARPNLFLEAITLIKARIKDKCVCTSCIGLDMLNQCMKGHGVDFQLLVAKKVLQRVLKLATPNKGTHPRVQRKAASLIMEWESSGASDNRLVDFTKAFEELKKCGGAVIPITNARPTHEDPSPKPSNTGRRTSIPRPHSLPN